MIIASNGHTLSREWASIEPLLELGNEKGRGGLDLGDIKEFVLSGRDLLWRIIDDGNLIAAAVTQMVLHDDTRAKTCVIVLMAGIGFDVWGRTALGIIEQYAKDNGCCAVSFRGRKAWLRVLPEYAFDGIWYERILI